MGILDRIAFTGTNVEPPEAIDVTESHDFRILWPGGAEVLIPSVRLRDSCPCAACVEEGTGRKILDPATIPPDVHPIRVDAVGNYAIQIQWSDGHNTGIYTWQALREASGLGTTRPR